MFDLPKPILKALLTARNTRRETLTVAEQAIADRIEQCSCCDYLWVRRKHKSPGRCPQCASPLWNRPLINTMLAHMNPTVESLILARKQIAETSEGGDQS